MLKELNATGRRKLPEDAPTDFLPQRLKPIVINHGEVDRRAWECALLLKLRDELKAGNLSVRYSKRFARLEEFFIDDRRWQSIREDFFRHSGLPSDTKQVQEYLARRLGEAYERFLKTAPSNSYAVVDKDGWRLSAVSRVLSECDPLANGIDLSMLEHVSPIEWDNVQYILDRKLVRQRRRAKKGRP